MKIGICAFVLLGSAAVAMPSLAQDVVQQTTVVREVTTDLNQFIGRNLFGWGHANLGVVSAADRHNGVIGVTGRHGEFALISGTLLTRDGVTLYAPTLTAGDIKVASEANLAHPGAVLGAPQVLIIEPPPG
ncbi:MAG: hypothetical protein KGO48_12420 [Alphaproteobacteria bacterium]|nr:hypothetical protein [Alphaproteobacteria bacterium]